MKKLNVRCFAIAILILASSSLCAQKAVNVQWQKLPAHPRLFANEAKILSVKSQKDSVSQHLLFLLKSTADDYLTAAAISYPASISNMGTSRNVQGRLLALALAYRILGDERYLTKAKEELLALAAISNWGTSHFLDVGEAALAAGIGYDWLYHKLTTDERKAIAEAIKTKAIIPGLGAKERGETWVNGNFNWNPVCHGGLIVGALAIAEEEPELAKAMVQQAVSNIPAAGVAYGPDGSFAEGPSYWSYGTSFYVIAVEALRSALGTSYGLEKIPGFLKTADYRVQMVGATGDDYNYSDYHIERHNEPIMAWFGRELMRPDLIQDERNHLANLYEASLQKNAVVKGRKTVLSRHLPLELLWWDPSLLQNKKVQSPPLQWTADGEMPISVMRTAWNDSGATFVAIKGGTPDNSHGHMDAGSFILEAAGVRWALDLGTESYDKMRQAKLDLWNYTQASNRWTTFRVGPEGHNILRFNGERQLISGKGQVKQLALKNGEMGAEADLTSLYSKWAKGVSRKVMINADRSVSIHDSWTAADSAVTVSSQWLTKAAVTKTADGLQLQQGGQILHLKIALPNSVAVDVQDVSKSRAVQDSDNPGLTRIVFSTKTAAGEKGSFQLIAQPKVKSH